MPIPDVMVPLLEQPEYMYELRNIADNIVRERCKHSEVQPPTHIACVASYKVADVSEGVEEPVESQVPDGSPSTHGDGHVGPAFHIPMTQEKTLLELPSQLDFDWQEQASQGPSIAPATARNLGEQLDEASTRLNAAMPIHVQEDTFVQVSQIAHEAVMDATQQPFSTITTNTMDPPTV